MKITILIKTLMILLLACLNTTLVSSIELPGLQPALDIWNNFVSLINKHKDVADMTLEELGRSRGKCSYNFIDYIRYRDKSYCEPDDKHVMHLMIKSKTHGARKPPIMVNCIQMERPKFAYENTLKVVESVKEVVELLKPIGNATKRHEPGSCVFVLFNSKASYSCTQVAPHANMLPLYFPTLRFAVIDSDEFHNFNGEFGIVGLPTFMLFHQGRAIVKFYIEAGTFFSFVTRHTGIKPIEPTPYESLLHRNILPTEPEDRTDYVLILAWAFVIICAGYHMTDTRWYKQLVEIIKRNWRESEAQLEHN